MKRFTIHWKGLGKDSLFDWHFCLVCFTLALSVIVFIDGYMYVSLSDFDSVSPVPNPTPVVMFNRANVDLLAEKLRAKDTTPHIVPQSVLRDPSF